MSFWYTFGGSALEAGCSDASTGTGAIAVGSGVLSLSPGSAGTAVVTRDTTANFSTAGTIRTIHLPVNGGTGSMCAGGKSSTPTQRIPVVGRTVSGNVFGGFYRDSDGYPTAAFSVAYTPWIRFRRSGTTIVYETSSDSTTGVDGTWTSIGSYADDDLWSAAALATVTEIAFAEGNSTHSMSAWGDPSTAGPVPTVGGIAPTSGPVGTEVTITGTNLTGATLATHGPSVAMIGLVVDSSTQVRATIATGSPASGTVRVTTPSGIGIGPTFTITPIFTSLSIANPNGSYTLGVPLSPIVVTKLDQFGTAMASGGPTECTVRSLGDVDVTGTLTIAFSGATATFSDLIPVLDVIAPPVLASFTPSSGVSGTVVTLTGTGFTGATAVELGGIPCLFSVVNDTTILATVP